LEESNSFDESSNQYVGRLAWVPLVSKDRSNLLHLGVGYRYSDAKQGVRYVTEPELNKAPDFIETDFLTADKTQTYNVEFAWRRGPALLTSEYTHIDASDGAVDGGEMQIATLGLNWWLTPFFSVNMGYKYIWNEMDGQKAESSGVMTRLILVLE